MGENILTIVVTYNRRNLLVETIDALLAQDVMCDILIVDNNSTDGTGEYLDRTYSEHNRIHISHLPQNIGGAGGFNYGMRWGVENGYAYVWIMDDDCIVHTNTLSCLIEADRILGGPENYGFLSSCVLWTDGKGCIMNRQKIVKNFYDHVELVQYGIVPIFQASFVSLLIPRETILEYGLPIKDYFIWNDDIEYTQRISLRGRKESFLVGRSIVTHKMRSNVGSDISQDSIERLNRYRLAFRNENYTYRHRGFKGICIYYGRVLRTIKDILLHAKSHRLKRLHTLFRGVLQGMIFFPKTEHISVSQPKQK